MVVPDSSRTGETRERSRCPGRLPLISSYAARPVSSTARRAQNCGIAPESFVQPKTSAQARPMICSGGAPIMSAKAPLAYKIRESRDCTQTPSSIASKSIPQTPGDAHSSASEHVKLGSDDSSFVVIFYWAFQPPFLRVFSVRFLPSKSLASDPSQDRYFAMRNEISILTHAIGIFPQSLGNITHRMSRSAGLTSPYHIDYVGLPLALLRRRANSTRRNRNEDFERSRRFGSRPLRSK